MSNLDPIEAKAVAVFISYSHDSPEHRNRVGELCDRLRAEGLDCHIDQYEDSPSEGWPLWMLNQVEKADFILVVSTETYYQRVRGREEPHKGLGKWEGMLITQSIYESVANEKFIPIVFSATDVKHIPVFLRAYTYYNLETEDGYEALYRRLTNQPYYQKPKLGHLRPMASLKRTEIPPTLAKNEGGITTGDLLGGIRIQPAGQQENSSQDRGSPTAQTGKPPAGEAAGGQAEARAMHVWIICAVLFAAVVAVFILAPDRLPEYKQRILAVVCAALSGALSFFLSGRIAVEIKAIKSRLGEMALQSTGGMAVFVLVLWWWLSPLSPVVAVPPPATPKTEAKPVLAPLKNLTAGSAVYSIALSRGGEFLASSEDGGSVHLWQAGQENGSRLLEEKEDAKLTRWVALSADDSVVVAGSDDGKIRWWRTDTGHLLNIWKAYSKKVFDIAFGTNHEIVSAGEDSDGVRAVKVWNSDGKLLKTWPTPELNDRIIAMNPDMQAVAILSASGGNIHVWLYNENKERKVLDDSGVEVRGGDFSRDGELFVAGSRNGTARLWRVSDGRLLGKYEDAQAEGTCIAFHSDSQLISVGHADGSVYLWRVGETHPLAKLKAYAANVLAVAFSPDGGVLASGGVDKVIQVWRVELPDKLPTGTRP